MHAHALLPVFFTLTQLTISSSISWDEASTKALQALAKLSNEEKATIITGTGWEKGPCVGNTAAVKKIGWPELCLQDGPLGIRYAQNVTAFPAGITVGSTWDRDLMYRRGYAMGEEAKALGVHVQLGPVAGPLGKIPTGGRNWEGFSNDPYLAGIGMAETIKGMQDAGVQACAKHYIGNEQELNRNTQSANIDDRTLHELYLWPFAEAVRANVSSVMCSYNRFHGEQACESSVLLNEILKDELDFKGYVMSDWGAQHTTIGSANSGLDMAMPGDSFNNKFLWGSTLLAAIANGTVAQSRLDDMVIRILTPFYLLSQDISYPARYGWTSWNGGKGGPDVQSNHKEIAREIARDGIVLLKNNGILPLSGEKLKGKGMAVVGWDAVVNEKGANGCVDRGCDNGTMAMGYGSGTAEFPYLIDPITALKSRATLTNITIYPSLTNFLSTGAEAASKAEVAIVFINAISGEGYITVEGNMGDRKDLEPWHNGTALVTAVARENRNTIVVIHSVGPLILESIVENENVSAIVWANVPGQESGSSLAEILYGDVSPSGKLPYTIAKKGSDYNASISTKDDAYEEGLYIDYKYFEKNGIVPRYEFGFGLSYTTFTYSNLSISTLAEEIPKKDVSTTSSQTHSKIKITNTALYDIISIISIQISNTGSVPGSEIAQLYLSFPPTASASMRTPRQLRGFQKVKLGVGERKIVRFEIRRKDVSVWDSEAKEWVVVEGSIGVDVGGNSGSGDERARGVLRI